MFVKPGPQKDDPSKLRVVKRGRWVLPEAGAEVPDDSFWQRRLRDGDVIEAQPPTTEAAGA